MAESQSYKKKLIEVAIPLEAINKESAREKSIRHGHPSTLHLWWARRPLAACRAVLFASLVDDPSSHPEQFPNEAAQEMERRRLFKIIEDLVKWENSNNEEVLAKARAEIMRSTDNNPPAVLDPFCGGGSIPLEAQRLGLEAHGSDLNPVAVLITKALIEIPPKFTGKAPVNHNFQKSKKKQTAFKGAEGLAADVAYYGEWMRDEAYKKIGKLYPKVRLPKEQGGDEANVIAWIWARTVKCPNPVCGCEMPLVRSFALSTKKGKEVWIEPIIKKGKPPKIEFVVKSGKAEARDGVVNRRGAHCISCESPTSFEYIRAEAKADRMGQKLMAIVAEGSKGRAYLSPDQNNESIAFKAKPIWKPETELPEKALGFRVQAYGMTKHSDLFTNRQLVALTTFSDLIGEVREKIIKDAIAAGIKDNGKGLEDGGLGATAYSDAVSLYLALSIGKLSDVASTICSWNIKRDGLRNTFARQAIPMTWDFAEVNVFSDSTGNFLSGIDWIKRSLERLPACGTAVAMQANASQLKLKRKFLISTDPPYYDNIGYADLSDYFYIWIRKSLGPKFSGILSTLLVPKADELIASPFRFDNSKEKAKEFFENGFTKTFRNFADIQSEEYPLIVYYAFKQVDEESSHENDHDNDAIGYASAGWETILNALIKAGYEVRSTWPLRTERASRTVARETNALASSIAIICRPRTHSAPSITLLEFKKRLRKELIPSIIELQKANLAPVDLPQSAIGPGISVFSKNKSVIDSNGEIVSVRQALIEINKVLSEFLDGSHTTFDNESLWAIEWFKIHQFEQGSYGDADNLARAKNTAVESMVSGGIAIARAGKVKLLARTELPSDWDPQQDHRISIWEKTQHLAKTLEEQGEAATAKLIIKIGSSADDAKSLAYRLFSIAESNGWIEDARTYNALIMSWSEINKLTA